MAGAYPQFGLRFSIDGARSSDLGLAFQGRLDEEIERRLDLVTAAYMRAAQQVMEKDRGKLRADIAGGGFNQAARLAKTWRGQVYPNRGKGSLEPAVWLKTKNRTLIEVFSETTTIRAVNAHFLAIPVGPAKAIVRKFNRSVQVSRRSGGFGRDAGGRYSKLGGMVGRVESYLGVKLRPVISKDGQHGVLVAEDNRRLTPTGRLSKSQRGAGTPLFVLVRQATLKKRIEGDALLAKIERGFHADFTAALAANLPAEVR